MARSDAEDSRLMQLLLRHVAVAQKWPRMEEIADHIDRLAKLLEAYRVFYRQDCYASMGNAADIDKMVANFEEAVLNG